MTVYNSAVEGLKEARQPFDQALEAIEAVNRHNEYVISILIEVFKSVYPDFKDLSVAREMLRRGDFPQVYFIDGSLRVHGELNLKESLITYLQKLEKYATL